MRVILAILLFAHGLIHLMGFAKAFALADLPALKGAISRPAGSAWLLAALLYVGAGILFLSGSDSWWMPGAGALVLSQMLIIRSWGDAKFGTVANAIILVPLVIAVANALPSSYRNSFRREAMRGLERRPAQAVLREGDIARLPRPVQEYLRFAGALGKPVPGNFRAMIEGQIRSDMNGRWMDIRARQYEFFDEPARVFLIESSIFGIPFDGLHIYRRGIATMQIQVGSLVQVVDAKGPEMNQGETVTLFNDMCLLAPATLADRNIRWDSLAPLSVRASFSAGGNTIHAELSFGPGGELTGFSSQDRYQSTDGVVYNRYGWSTPVGQYSDFHGVKIPSYGEAIWHTPRGDFAYARFTIKELEYDCSAFP